LPSENKLFIVGIGPGQRNLITLQALKAIEKSKFVVGHRTYIELIKDLLDGKEAWSSGMGQEVDRAKTAVDLLESGPVTLVSSGDPNIYGMAGLGLEVACKNIGMDRVEIIPGVTSLTAVACRAGITFLDSVAFISLSDLLTPFSEIECRIKLASELGMSVGLYNPRSRNRNWQLEKALKYFRSETYVLIARNLGREGEELTWSRADKLVEENDLKKKIDMFTLVLICGNNIHHGKAFGESKINVVGVGPGNPDCLTLEARELLTRSDKIFGSKRYLQTVRNISQIEGILHDGDCSQRMKLRFQEAKAASEKNQTSSILTGGDPSIFSAAWRILEEAKDECNIHVSPGISAFSAVAAKAGAPLVNDFALVSQAKEPAKIARLNEAGFGVVAYNVHSNELDAVLQGISKERPCALARDINRMKEEMRISTAIDLLEARVEGTRFTLIIASHNSFINDNRIITRRGYQSKYGY
jgi:precorrin-3B C17-methyltransferase / cobalt-factor III methyltransferase